MRVRHIAPVTLDTMQGSPHRNARHHAAGLGNSSSHESTMQLGPHVAGTLCCWLSPFGSTQKCDAVWDSRSCWGEQTGRSQETSHTLSRQRMCLPPPPPSSKTRQATCCHARDCVSVSQAATTHAKPACATAHPTARSTPCLGVHAGNQPKTKMGRMLTQLMRQLQPQQTRHALMMQVHAAWSAITL